jgi:hypothetical protein
MTDAVYVPKPVVQQWIKGLPAKQATTDDSLPIPAFKKPSDFLLRFT